MYVQGSFGLSSVDRNLCLFLITSTWSQRKNKRTVGVKAERRTVLVDEKAEAQKVKHWWIFSLALICCCVFDQWFDLICESPSGCSGATLAFEHVMNRSWTLASTTRSVWTECLFSESSLWVLWWPGNLSTLTWREAAVSYTHEAGLKPVQLRTLTLRRALNRNTAAAEHSNMPHTRETWQRALDYLEKNVDVGKREKHLYTGELLENHYSSFLYNITLLKG